MIEVSDWFRTWMEKQTLTLLRKFTYDDTHETEKVQGFGSINRASDAIVSGGTSLALINTDKHWNKFLSDKSNLRREAKIQLAIGVPNTPARSGIARSGATLSNLLSYTPIPGNQEWLDILTGWADDPEFIEALVNLSIRDKLAGLLEKELGSKESPLDYCSSAHNPADLTWSILTTHGGLDSTASTANTDIDYTSWSTWKTACTVANLSLKARFTGQTIREALELIRDLTNSDIYVGGEGKFKFFRFVTGIPPTERYLFNTDKFNSFSVDLDSEKIVNYLKVYYGFSPVLELIINGDMEAENSWLDRGTPTTNVRSDEQANSDIYSRKIATDAANEGAYQDFATVVGRWYRAEAYIYVSAGDARLGKEDTDGSDQVLSSQATAAQWKRFSLTFRATEVISRIFFQSDTVANSVFYVDDLSVKWVGPEAWAGFYLKEDATSQQQPPDGFGLSSKTIDSIVIWHDTLASATSYGDRRIQTYANPLEVIFFTSFMMGMITEVGDIVRISNPFFGYTGEPYFRVFKITNLDLATGTIAFQIANFQDVSEPSFSTPSVHGKSSEGQNEIANTSHDISWGLGSENYLRACQKILLTGDTLEKVSFLLLKHGSPTGTAYVRVRKVSDDSITETSSTTLDVATLPTDSPIWKDFPFTCAPNEEVRISIEYNGGDANNFVRYYALNSDVISGEYQGYVVEWLSANTFDATIKLLFSLCEAVNTVDDDLATFWIPDPPNEAGAWISWDIGSLKYLSGCRIYWGSEAAYRPTEYKLWVSVNGTDWTEVVHETEAPPASAWKTYSWDTQEVRYFKLTVITHGASGTKVYEVDEYSI